MMREINLFESLCLYRNLAVCQLFSFNVLCVEHRQAGLLCVFFSPLRRLLPARNHIILNDLRDVKEWIFVL